MNICIVYGSTKLIPVYSGTLKKCVHRGFATANMEFKILAGLNISLNTFDSVYIIAEKRD